MAEGTHPHPAADFRFVHRINRSYHKPLEDLFYFNALQKRYSASIDAMVDLYGMPSIKQKEDFITIQLSKRNHCENLFAIYGPLLIGVLVYFTDTPESLVIPHIAINVQYTQKGIYADQMLTMKMIDHLLAEHSTVKHITYGYRNNQHS